MQSIGTGRVSCTATMKSPSMETMITKHIDESAWTSTAACLGASHMLVPTTTALDWSIGIPEHAVQLCMVSDGSSIESFGTHSVPWVVSVHDLQRDSIFMTDHGCRDHQRDAALGRAAAGHLYKIMARLGCNKDSCCLSFLQINSHCEDHGQAWLQQATAAASASMQIKSLQVSSHFEGHGQALAATSSLLFRPWRHCPSSSNTFYLFGISPSDQPKHVPAA